MWKLRTDSLPEPRHLSEGDKSPSHSHFQRIEHNQQIGEITCMSAGIKVVQASTPYDGDSVTTNSVPWQRN
jgi:hypothetical protein